MRLTYFGLYVAGSQERSIVVVVVVVVVVGIKSSRRRPALLRRFETVVLGCWCWYSRYSYKRRDVSPFPPCKMSTFSPHIFPSLYGERREDEDDEEGLEGDEMVRAMRFGVVGRRLWRRSTHRCATVVPVQDRRRL